MLIILIVFSHLDKFDSFFVFKTQVFSLSFHATAMEDSAEWKAARWRGVGEKLSREQTDSTAPSLYCGM